jgi:hypothetical protein
VCVQALSDENKQLRKRLVVAGLGEARDDAEDPLGDLLATGGGVGGAGGGGPKGLLHTGHEAARQRLLVATAANKMTLKVVAPTPFRRHCSSGRLFLSPCCATKKKRSRFSPSCAFLCFSGMLTNSALEIIVVRVLFKLF